MKGFINLTHTNNGKIESLRQYLVDYFDRNFATSIDLTIDSSTYVMSAQLKDNNGDPIGTASTIDLPLESVVVSGSYDSLTKEVVLTLESGSEVRFSVADLVSGLQTEITSQNKLSSDLVDDTNKTNKFVTTAEKSVWNNKQGAIITGTGAPTTSTVGNINDLYRDSLTNIVYICTGVAAQGTNPETYVYTWNSVNKLYAHNIDIKTDLDPSISEIYASHLTFTIYNSTPTQMTYNDIVAFLTSSGYTEDYKGYPCVLKNITYNNGIGYMYYNNNLIKVATPQLDASITVNNFVYRLNTTSWLAPSTIYTFGSTQIVTDTILEM